MTSGASTHIADRDPQPEAAHALFSALRAHAPAYRQRSVPCAEHGLLPIALSGGIALLAVALFWLSQPVGAAAAVLLMLAGAGAFALELLGRENPLRWVLPERESALAQACWRGESSSAVVVAAALRPLASPPVPLAAWRWALGLSLGAQLALIALFAVGIVLPERALRGAAVALAVIPLVTGALALAGARQARREDASAAHVLTALAHSLAAQPPRRHTVCLVLSSAPTCLLTDALAPENGTVHARLLLFEPSDANSAAFAVATQTGWLRAQPSDLALLTLARRVAESATPAPRFEPLPLPCLPPNTLAIQVGTGETNKTDAPTLAFLRRMIHALDATSNG